MKDTLVQNKFGSSIEKKSVAAGTIAINTVTRLNVSQGAKNEVAFLYDIVNGDQTRNIPVIIFNAKKPVPVEAGKGQ